MIAHKAELAKARAAAAADAAQDVHANEGTMSF